MKRKITLLAGLFLVYTLTTQAQAPQSMNYQAIVRNSSGAALGNGINVSVRFSIHDATPTGTVVFTEVNTAVTNQFGLISQQIGGTGNLAAVNWGSGPKYLQVEIDPTGGTNFTDMGTSQMVSVPYALFAGNGLQGPTGPQGVAGAQGAQGVTGATGTSGTAGSTGATGAQGPIGLNGSQGSQGIQGTQGPTGPQGPFGSQGVPGLQGATGAQGPIGLQGPQGTAGSAGATGPTGPQGLQGFQGSQGPSGVQGNPGNQGPVGSTGPGGSTGPQGASGPSGADGNTGPVGPSGPAGPSGPQGTAGTQGQQGLVGATGPAGPTGAGGQAGPTGLQGNQGIQGFPGDTGPTGPGGSSNTVTYSAVGNTDESTSSSGFSNLNQMNISFTPLNSTVYVEFTAGGNYTNDEEHNIWFNLVVNGNVVKSFYFTGASLWNDWQAAFSYPLSVSVGNSTNVSIQWATDNQTSYTIYNYAASYNYDQRSLIIYDHP